MKTKLKTVPVLLNRNQLLSSLPGVPVSRIVSAERSGNLLPDARDAKGLGLYGFNRLAQITTLLQRPEVIS